MSIRGALSGGLIAVSVMFSASAVERPSEPLEFRSTPPGRTERVIVEFHGEPVVRATTVSAANYENVFERFRSDLMAPAAGKRGVVFTPVIHHEYRTALLGATVEVAHGSVERLRRLPYVRSVTPDGEVRAAEAVDPRPSDSPIDARTKVNALPLGVGGEGIVVAVIDTGIDYLHPALGGGYGPGFKVVGGYDFVNKDDDPIDDEGHGTHVAGTIAANASGLLGVAPDAMLLAYKVLSQTGNGSDSDVIAAIERALDPNQDGDLSDRADVLNLSLGGTGDAEDPVSRAVDAAVAAGAVVVVAAGNAGGTATIGSPGTAVDAITVAAVDDLHAVTGFSSRGPSPRLLGFKPDVAAPGDQISSTRIGGGVLSLSGTSMASPHVAGVAALLIQLHPDWDPPTVKSAITSGAVPVADQAFARGAGRVDADAAHRAKLFRDQSGLSFGLRAARDGSSTATQTFSLSNRSSATQSLSIQPGTLPDGVSISIVPSSIQIEPGASAQVTVELDADHERLEYPEDATISGDLLISGTSTMSVPWGILRTARATVSYDGLMSLIVMSNDGGGRRESIRIGGRAEFFLPPGQTWDLIVEGYDIPEDEGALPDVRRIVIREVEVDADEVFEVSGAEASLELSLDGRDQRDIPVVARPAEDSIHLIGSRLLRQVDGSEFSIGSLDYRDSISRMFFSPFPERFRLYLYEQFIDYAANEAYSIEFDLVEGLQESRVLTAGGADLLHAGVHWRRPPMQDQSSTLCSFSATTTRITLSITDCLSSRTNTSNMIDVFLTEERAGIAHIGLVLGSGALRSQALRGRDGEIVVSSDRVPGPVSQRIASGGDYHLSAGPAFPFAFPGTSTGVWYGFSHPGFYGSAGELISEGKGTRWTIYDAQGQQTSAGLWRGVSGTVPPPPATGTRLVAERHDLEGYGHFSSGVLEVSFGVDSEDLTAPTLTSLRVVDAAGRTVAGVAPGAQAMLSFSIADSTFERAGETKPSRPEMTRAWARRRGAREWQSLPVVVTGNESGSLVSLHHFPAGDMYVADLAAISGSDGWIDIRIDFEDVAGNKVTWTQEMAFAVGDPAQKRGRAVR